MIRVIVVCYLLLALVIYLAPDVQADSPPPHITAIENILSIQEKVVSGNTPYNTYIVETDHYVIYLGPSYTFIDAIKTAKGNHETVILDGEAVMAKKTGDFVLERQKIRMKVTSLTYRGEQYDYSN